MPPSLLTCDMWPRIDTKKYNETKQSKEVFGLQGLTSFNAIPDSNDLSRTDSGSEKKRESALRPKPANIDRSRKLRDTQRVEHI